MAAASGTRNAPQGNFVPPANDRLKSARFSAQVGKFRITLRGTAQIGREPEEIGKHAACRDLRSGAGALHDERLRMVTLRCESDNVVTATGAGKGMRARIAFQLDRASPLGIYYSDITEHFAAVTGLGEKIGHHLVMLRQAFEEVFD